jgi:CheY-like chemotaxis protein
VLDLNEQMLTMAELLRRTLGETIALATLLEPRLWSVRADPGEIENAVLNLAINARDAMPEGGKLVIETRNVTLDDRDILDAHDVSDEASLGSGRYVRLSISDTGRGMPPEVLARAFEPFFTTKEPGKGTGLGLSVIYGFVRQSGGHVTIRSKVGEGTTVSLYLPPVHIDDVAGTDSKAADETRTAVETVLLVEDNAEVRAVTTQRLQNQGYTVLQADTAARAIELLQADVHVDIVFSDVVMPGGMSGLDLARWMAQQMPHVPILLTSGYAEEVARQDGVRAQKFEMLRKPYTGAELSRALRAALSR